VLIKTIILCEHQYSKNDSEVARTNNGVEAVNIFFLRCDFCSVMKRFEGRTIGRKMVFIDATPKLPPL
jgi:hypothetical protein